MILSEEKRQEFIAAATPLMMWIEQNCHPHCEATVCSNEAHLLEGIVSHVHTRPWDTEVEVEDEGN